MWRRTLFLLVLLLLIPVSLYGQSKGEKNREERQEQLFLQEFQFDFLQHPLVPGYSLGILSVEKVNFSLVTKLPLNKWTRLNRENLIPLKNFIDGFELQVGYKYALISLQPRYKFGSTKVGAFVRFEIFW
jgi:hypothetical protein